MNLQDKARECAKKIIEGDRFRPEHLELHILAAMRDVVEPLEQALESCATHLDGALTDEFKLRAKVTELEKEHNDALAMLGVYKMDKDELRAEVARLREELSEARTLRRDQETALVNALNDYEHQVDALQSRVKELEEALRWYAQNGYVSHLMLGDAGQKARSVLAAESKSISGNKM